MKIAVFDTHPFERKYLEAENARHGYSVTFFETRLRPETAPLAAGHDVVCAFANDRLDAETLTVLHGLDVRLIALRSAGFNHVDVRKATALRLPVVRVPAYAPHAIAEHAVALLLALVRKIPQAHQRVQQQNFTLDGLAGFTLHGKTVGVIGTGKIGAVFATIMKGFGCRVLAYDKEPKQYLLGSAIAEYVPLEKLYRESQIISLHVPLTSETHHMIDARAFALMRPETILVNTGRGKLIDSAALISALKTRKIGGACLDVYEEEESLFFADHSTEVLQDDVLARLLTFNNVLITAHQAFLTEEALAAIARVTFENIHAYDRKEPLFNSVTHFETERPLAYRT